MGKHSDFRISSFRVVDAWRILQFNRKTEKYIKEFIWFGGTLSQNYRVNGLMRLGTLNKFELWFVQNVGILVSQLEEASEEFNSKKLMEEIKRTNTVNKGSCKNCLLSISLVASSLFWVVNEASSARTREFESRVLSRVSIACDFSRYLPNGERARRLIFG